MQFFFPTNKQVAFTRGSNKAISLLVPLSASMRLFSPPCKMAFMIQPRYFLWNCLSCKIPYTWQMKIMFSIPNTPLSGYLGACLVVSHWDSDADWRSTSWAHTRLLTLGATRRSLTYKTVKLLGLWVREPRQGRIWASFLILYIYLICLFFFFSVFNLYL